MVFVSHHCVNNPLMSRGESMPRQCLALNRHIRLPSIRALFALRACTCCFVQGKKKYILYSKPSAVIPLIPLHAKAQINCTPLF